MDHVWEHYQTPEGTFFLMRMIGTKPQVFGYEDSGVVYFGNAKAAADQAHALNKFDADYTESKAQAVTSKDVAGTLNGWLNASKELVRRCKANKLPRTAADLEAIDARVKKLRDFTEELSVNCEASADSTVKKALKHSTYHPQALPEQETPR
jgi:phosphomannomutase